MCTCNFGDAVFPIHIGSVHVGSNHGMFFIYSQAKDFVLVYKPNCTIIFNFQHFKRIVLERYFRNSGKPRSTTFTRCSR